jgi:membrane associated rhomboid family serine protease
VRLGDAGQALVAETRDGVEGSRRCVHGEACAKLRNAGPMDINLHDTPATILFLAVSIGVSIWAFQRVQGGRLDDEFLFEPWEVSQGRNKRGMLLSQFSHADPAHLIFNMFTLYSFGPVIELTLGSLNMVLIYVASAIGSTLLVYARHKDEPGYRALGASGAISGVVFGAIVLYPEGRISVFFLPDVPAPIFAILYVLFSIFAARRRLGNIGHDAHLGGAVAGFLLTGLMAPDGFQPLMATLHHLLGR